MANKEAEKRGRGRPKLHEGGTKMVAFRVPLNVATAINGALATLKTLSPQDMATPLPVHLIEALKMRLALYGNLRPAQVKVAIKALDKALVVSYGHVERDR